MERQELNGFALDDLWLLHGQVSEILEQKIKRQKLLLEQRLGRLRAPERRPDPQQRRPYPPVEPKYRNPEQAAETWSGRGKQPRWLVEQLKKGRLLDDFRI
jgi:DNA-binding protein H-NS